MSTRNRKDGQLGPPTKEQEAQKRAQAEKKEFIRNLMRSPRLIVFTGNNNVLPYGFPSDGDLLLFLLDQVYGWDGHNPNFQSILQKIKEASTQAQAPVDDVDKILDELEPAQEDSTLPPSHEEDMPEEESGEELAAAAVVPINKNNGETEASSEVEQLKARLAELEQTQEQSA